MLPRIAYLLGNEQVTPALPWLLGVLHRLAVTGPAYVAEILRCPQLMQRLFDLLDHTISSGGHRGKAADSAMMNLASRVWKLFANLCEVSRAVAVFLTSKGERSSESSDSNLSFLHHPLCLSIILKLH